MKKKICTMLLICGMLLGLVACGGGESEQSGAQTSKESEVIQEQTTDDLVYYATNLGLGIDKDETYVDFKVYETNIFYPEGQSIVTYNCREHQKRTEEYRWADATQEWSISRVCYSEIGEVYAVVTVQTTPNSTRYLCKFDIDRNLVFAQELEQYYEDVGETFSDNSRLEQGSDGRIYLSSSGMLWIFEEDGSYKGQVSFGNTQNLWMRDMQCTEEGKLYVLYDDNSNQKQYVAEIDTAAGEVTAQKETNGLSGITVQGDTLLCYDSIGVYAYNREKQTMTESFKWADCNVDGTIVYGIRQMSDGSILLAKLPSWGGIENSLVKSMTLAESIDSGTGKIDIRFALLNEPSNILQTAVVRYNKNSEKYNIVLETYNIDSAAGARARLNAELDAGNGPDIVDMNFGDVESLVERGCLEDLSLYLEESEFVSEGDFLNLALEEYRVDGTLVAIPHHFSIQILLGRSDLLGEEPGWTMEEMLGFMEMYAGEEIFADGETQGGFWLDMLFFNEGYFIDREAGTCNFDNDIFRRMVEVMKSLPEEWEAYYEGKPSDYDNLMSGQGILCNVYMTDFWELQAYEEALGGAMNCIGYPIEEGIGVVATTYDAFGISSESNCKEGAWEFMEYYIKFTMDGVRGTYFPTYVPSLDKVAERALTYGNSGVMHSGEFSFKQHTSTQEEVDLVYQLLEAAQVGESRDGELADIVMEELEGYFAEEKALDEVIENIENRVQLYLTEN